MAFPIAALVMASFFAGAAIYISLVEHPARLVLDDGPMLAQWQPSYARALPIQSGLALAGGAAGLIAWHGGGGWQWLAGSLALLANWPFTVGAVMPTNKRLMRISPPDAGAESRTLLIRWGRLHGVRSLLGLLATGLFAWAMLA